MKAALDEYRCPDETYQLLLRWGRCYLIGAPHLKYPKKAAVVGDYLPKRVKEQDPPSYDMAEFDRLCLIIDNNLSLPKVEALKCKFMYRDKNGRWWSRRQSAQYLGITIDEYLTLLRSSMRMIDILMDVELEEINQR